MNTANLNVFLHYVLKFWPPSNHASIQRMHTNLNINKRKLKIPFFHIDVEV